MKVGDTIWRFDINTRVYEKKPGHKYSSGGPIYRHHWVKTAITGETSRSWITDYYGKKVPKSGPHFGWAFSEREVDEDCWQHSHRWKIVDAVKSCDARLLRQIAQIIGYNA